MKLQDRDIEQLTSAMFIFIHAVERIVHTLTLHYEAIDRDSQDYKIMQKALGKMMADQWLHENEKQIMLQAKGQMLHLWLDAAHKLSAATDQATKVGMIAPNQELTPMQLFNNMLSDSNWLVRLYLLQGNIRPDHYEQAEQTLRKLWDKDYHPVRSKLIDLFRPQI